MASVSLWAYILMLFISLLTAGLHYQTSGTITIYDHREPQSDWAACFALTCNLGTGPGATMYVVLYNSTADGKNPYKVVATGFSDENGHVFTGLNPSEIYWIYPVDCNLCHGSTHDVLFDHWGNYDKTRPLSVRGDGVVLNAYYLCNNECGNGP